MSFLVGLGIGVAGTYLLIHYPAKVTEVIYNVRARLGL
jgi:hypothetical protein